MRTKSAQHNMSTCAEKCHSVNSAKVKGRIYGDACNILELAIKYEGKPTFGLTSVTGNVFQLSERVNAHNTKHWHTKFRFLVRTMAFDI